MLVKKLVLVQENYILSTENVEVFYILYVSKYRDIKL